MVLQLSPILLRALPSTAPLLALLPLGTDLVAGGPSLSTLTLYSLVAGMAIAVGVVGIVAPVLPGTLLIAGALITWAFLVPDLTARIIVGVAVALLGAGVVMQYAWAGRTVTRAGVPRRSLLLGGVLAVIGFFVIPVVGLPVGFVAGIFAAERHRLGPGPGAMASTKAAVKGALLSMAVELSAALIAATLWGVAVAVAAA